jgi:hypothetical protein
MARARKSHDTGKEEVKSSRAKLEPAYSGKVGGNKLVVYADLQREGDPYARVLVLNFMAKYAARYFIDLLIHNDTWEWTDPLGSREALKTSSGVRVSMFKDDLHKLMDYKMSEDERSWEDEIVKQHTLRFKYGTHEAASKDDNTEHSHGSDETLSDGGTKKTKSKRGEPRAPKEPKVKVDKSGFVSAIEIAADSKLEGREVRGILRSSGLTKPDMGWMWPKGSPELKEAKKIIDAGIKALLKKKGKK